MDKPFDFNVLKAKLKDNGLDMAEDAIKKVTVDFLDWVEESCKIHPNPLVKVLVPLVPMLKQPILDLEDKIDGKVG